MLRLFDKDECPFCWKARIALAETNTPYELITLGPDDDRRELEKHSPTGTTPVLVNGAAGAIWESAVIVEFINDLTKNALLPGCRADRTRARLLHSYSDSEIGKHLREVVFEKRAKPEAEWDQARIAAGDAGWRACLDFLEPHLRGQDMFAGAFSMAECALYPRFALAERYGVGVDGRHPGLLRWYVNLQKRASCRTSRPTGWADDVAA